MPLLKTFLVQVFTKKELVFFKTLLAGYQYSSGAIPSHCAVNLRASVWYLLAGQRSRLEKPTEQGEEGELEVMKQDVQAFAIDPDPFKTMMTMMRMTPISIVHNWPIIIM